MFALFNEKLFFTNNQEGIYSQINFEYLLPLQKSFSKMIGVELAFLRGRSFLLEVAPSGAYERSVSIFTEELSQTGSTIFVYTRKSSPVYKLLSSKNSLRFFLSTDAVSYIKQTEKENEVLVPQNDLPILLEALSKSRASTSGSSVFVIDSISDMLVSSGFESTYKALKSANEIFADPNVTSLFIMMRGSHDAKMVAAIRNLYPTQLLGTADGTMKLLRE